MPDKKVYFITGGGTGGHIYPAIAVADALDGKIYYIGNPKNLEYDVVKQKSYDFLPINVFGMPRRLGLKFLFWGSTLIFAILKCVYYILRYKPDVIFGTGGYVSAPALFAAKILKKPFVMHDCDANPGLVTRKLASSASGVSLAFECAKNSINNKNSRVNGNPIRDGFKKIDKSSARDTLGLANKLTLCIMGGSQGAESINSASVTILKKLSLEYDIQIIFQTGKKKFSDVEQKLFELYPEFKSDKNLIVRPYFDDMVTVLKASDIAVSRAGSLSISELCASGIAAILVPYPYAAADHQRKNAQFMVDNDAGLYIEDSDLTPERLLDIILSLLNNREKLDSLQSAAFSLAKLDGTKSIIEQIHSVL